MNILHVVLNFFWYGRIEAKLKNIEYREMTPYWKKRIWDKRNELKTIVFHRGYTSTNLQKEITKIDIGVCPYDGWNDKYYRIHFK